MQCRVCSNTENNTLYGIREMMFGLREKFEYFQCGRCGCLQIKDIPADIKKYYPTKYYSFAVQNENKESKENSSFRKELKRTRDEYAILNRGFLGRMLYLLFPNEVLRNHMHNSFPLNYSGIDFGRNSRILDVGCGSGDYLYNLKECGFKYLSGIDPFIQEDILYANGLRIQKRSIFQIEGEFDVIIFHHSFEHMAEQTQVLKVVSNLLSKKGICIIRIPTVSSYAWEYYRENWVQVDAPRHFFLHSTESFKCLSEKTGLSIIKIVYDSTEFQFVGSELYSNNIPLTQYDNSKPIFSDVDISYFKTRAHRLNTVNRGDQAAFCLKRSQW